MRHHCGLRLSFVALSVASFLGGCQTEQQNKQVETQASADASAGKGEAEDIRSAAQKMIYSQVLEDELRSWALTIVPDRPEIGRSMVDGTELRTYFDFLFVTPETARLVAQGEVPDDVDNRIENELDRLDGLIDGVHPLIKILLEQHANKSLKPVHQEVLAQLLAGIDPNHPKEKLRKINSAIHSYHKQHKELPSVRIDGKPGLSWRVHLLPFLGRQELYDEFKTDQPWDSKHNAALIDKMPVVFQLYPEIKAGRTNVHIFQGPGSPLGSDHAIAFRDFAGGRTENAISFVVGGEMTAIEWTRPGGLVFSAEEPFSAVGQPIHDDGHPVIMADGSIYLVPRDIIPKQGLSLIRFDQSLPDNLLDSVERWAQ